MLIVGAAAWRIVARAARASPVEVCGALFGPPGGTATEAVVLPNVAPDPRRAFVVDDAAHLAALRRAEADGLIERALWHSHVDGGAELSAADLAGALLADGAPRLPGVLLVVVARGSGAGRAWRVDGGRAVEVPLAVA